MGKPVYEFNVISHDLTDPYGYVLKLYHWAIQLTQLLQQANHRCNLPFPAASPHPFHRTRACG